ncbi:MAG: hypothetical protein LBT40_04105 [Deltaproteobacteria bacterium]|jgi:hypothetical protein|nr:hypothetical protein [Deltaproteobacteria bacterium]
MTNSCCTRTRLDDRNIKRVPQPTWDLTYSIALVNSPFGRGAPGSGICFDPQRVSRNNDYSKFSGCSESFSLQMS